MSKKLIVVRCPNCGGEPEFPEDMEIGHCMYCGSKVLIGEEEGSTHYHGDVYHYDSKTQNFDQLKYNKEELEKEIEGLIEDYQEQEEIVNELGQTWGDKLDSNREWAKYFILASVISLILSSYHTVCCSMIFIILLIAGIWMYFCSASDEYNEYSEASDNLEELEKETEKAIAEKEKEIEEIEKRMRDWK